MRTACVHVRGSNHSAAPLGVVTGNFRHDGKGWDEQGKIWGLQSPDQDPSFTSRGAMPWLFLSRRLTRRAAGLSKRKKSKETLAMSRLSNVYCGSVAAWQHLSNSIRPRGSVFLRRLECDLFPGKGSSSKITTGGGCKGRWP